ncbi:MAG TPA: FG-GAP-like repeat-containing protein, partial [Bryobacteraceae bacterium]|nr:FG-GAP-like repeat-containing protein [Bryobacteraceae bacterium]
MRLITLVGLVLSAHTVFAASQTISFAQIPDQTLGSAPVVVTAKTSSGLPVLFESTTPSVCKAAGNLIVLMSPGPCFVTARQPGSAIYESASVSRGFQVRLAKPSGTLRLASSAGNSHTLSLIQADFNHDGVLDFAAANHEGTVTILLGDGSGGFRAAREPINFGTSVQALAAGDFDGDGNADLAIASGNDQVAVLLGDGAGAFIASPGSPFAAGTAPRSIAVADFNRDGAEDLAIANFAGGVTVLQGNGSGGFAQMPGSPFAAGAGTSAVVAADFNGDGLVDLASANSSDGNVSILLAVPAGGFAPAAGSPFAVGMLPQSIVIADFNRDGIEDLVIANRGNGTLAILLGNGSGGFVAAPGSPVAAGLSLQSVAAGDLDGDGIVDLVASNNTDGVQVFLGDGAGGVRRPVAFGSPLDSVSAVIGDFNGDGIADVAAANFLAGGVSILSGGLSDTVAILHAPSGPIAPGGSVSLILDLANPGPGFSGPSGTVTFLDGTRVLGAASEDTSPFTFTVSNLTAGVHHLNARYSGDARSLPISATMTITVGSAPSARSKLIAHADPPAPTFTTVGRTPSGTVTALDPDTQAVVTGTNIIAGSTQFMFTPPDGLGPDPAVGRFTVIQQAAQLVATIPSAYLTTAGTAYVRLLNGSSAFSSALPGLPFTIAPHAQTVTVGGKTTSSTAPAVLFTGASFVLSGRADTGMPTTFASTTPTVCRSAGTLIVPQTAGTCTVTITRPANDSYGANSLTETFPINKATGSSSFMQSTLPAAGA